MLYAWYGHLRQGSEWPLRLAILSSRGVALFEYALQVPANRIGHRVFEIYQLKILQEIITLGVFMPFSVLILRERLTWNYAAAAVLMVGAAFLVFRR